ncbi:right-handed parallel beta-helix repeat-containing protein [soil metagenome]
MSLLNGFVAVGDGRADDTEAIRHAIAEGDGHLFFPRGTYRLTGPIEVDLSRHGRTAISGSGGTATLRMEAPGPALRLVGTHDRTAAPEGFAEAVWLSERMPTVRDIEIVGEHDEAVGIELTRTMQATITGVLIRRCLYGIHLVERNRNFLLADSHIYHGRGPAIGVYFDGVNLHQANIVGCHISYHKHAGIKVERSEVRNLQITGNDIEYNHDVDAPDSADVWIDARESTVREGTIASNTIQAKGSPRGSNVRIEGPDRPDSAGAGLWTIVGNVLQDQQINLWLRNCRGVNVSGNSFASAYERSMVLERCRHVAVGPNTFDHNPDYGGDRIDGITVRQSSGCTFTGLIVEGSRAGTEESGAAFEVDDSDTLSIVGCQVLEPSVRGIELVNVRNCRISDCTVLDRRAEPTMKEAIRLTGPGRGNLVTNNIVGGGTVEILIQPKEAATLSGNQGADLSGQ